MSQLKSQQKPQPAYIPTYALLGLLLGLATCILRPQPAQAFQLRDHKQITTEAIQEFTNCFPEAKSALTQKWILVGDLGEDVNLITKELLYSHYFNPHKKLVMWRYDSSVRISRLESALAPGTGALKVSNTFSSMLELGQVIHHLQDASVPPHVVPVSHGLGDGFESFVSNSDISSGMSCTELTMLARKSPAQVLIETAEVTLLTVATDKVEVEAITFGRAQTMSLGLNAFWQEAPGDAFGEYGVLGNHYGEPQFKSPGGVLFNVPSDFYEHLKQKQMRLAVRATLQALLWYVNPIQSGALAQP